MKLFKFIRPNDYYGSDVGFYYVFVLLCIDIAPVRAARVPPRRGRYFNEVIHSLGRMYCRLYARLSVEVIMLWEYFVHCSCLPNHSYYWASSRVCSYLAQQIRCLQRWAFLWRYSVIAHRIVKMSSLRRFHRYFGQLVVSIAIYGATPGRRTHMLKG